MDNDCNNSNNINNNTIDSNNNNEQNPCFGELFNRHGSAEAIFHDVGVEI